MKSAGLTTPAVTNRENPTLAENLYGREGDGAGGAPKMRAKWFGGSPVTIDAPLSLSHQDRVKLSPWKRLVHTFNSLSFPQEPQGNKTPPTAPLKARDGAIPNTGPIHSFLNTFCALDRLA